MTDCPSCGRPLPDDHDTREAPRDGRPRRCPSCGDRQADLTQWGAN